MNKINKLWLIPAIIVVSLIALTFRQKGYNGRGNEIPVSGNIEVTEVRLAFRIPGRIAERLVDEGHAVTQGQLLARLDDSELVKAMSLRAAEKTAAEATLDELQSGALPEEIAQAKAKRDQAKADYQRQEADYERQKQLLRQEVISKREFDVSQAAYEMSKSRLQEATKVLDLIEKGVREEKITQAKARLKQASESLAIAKTHLDYTKLLAPISGSVLSKGAEAGEVIQAGIPVLVIGNLADVWLRAFISESDLGRIQLGDPVQIRTDTYPDKVYDGTVSFIASEAEFTPKNMQTTEERVKLVYRIKITVVNPNQELKPGMPADGLILVGQDR